MNLITQWTERQEGSVGSARGLCELVIQISAKDACLCWVDHTCWWPSAISHRGTVMSESRWRRRTVDGSSLWFAWVHCAVLMKDAITFIIRERNSH